MPTPCPASPNLQQTARAAALERLKAAGDGLSPALVTEGQTALRHAFALSDLLFGKNANGAA